MITRKSSWKIFSAKFVLGGRLVDSCLADICLPLNFAAIKSSGVIIEFSITINTFYSDLLQNLALECNRQLTSKVYKRQPSPQTSASKPWDPLEATSGDMKLGVPHIVMCFSSGRDNCVAKPKSAIF